MLLAFIFILIIIGLGILVSVYSIFLPFFENLNDIINYNTAYYGAVSSIERGLLITKYQEPGFEGSGGRVANNIIGPQSDFKVGDLGRLENENNSLYRNISSRTQQIPNTNQGNINYLLAGTGSENYNKITYNTIEKVFLSIDETDIVEDYYMDDNNITSFEGSSIVGTFRLPPKIFQKFGSSPDGLLCSSTNIANCDSNSNNIYDEIALQRNINGIYNGMEFLIIPYTHVFLNQNPAGIDILYDTNIRESTINYSTENIGYPNNIEFSDDLSNNYNPIITNSMSLINGHNIIIQDDTIIFTQNFRQIFEDSDDLFLQFGIGPLLKSQNGDIYPFLEYQLEFSEPISDRFYSIKGVGEVNLYKVEIILKKPTSDQDLSSDFTIIF